MKLYSLSSNLHVFPVLHGSAASSLALRQYLLQAKTTALLLPFAPSIQQEMEGLVADMPLLQALVFSQGEDQAYISSDPCDAWIETIRQSQLKRIPLHFVGPNLLPPSRDAQGIVDPWLQEDLGTPQWNVANLLTSFGKPSAPWSDYWHHIFWDANQLLGQKLLVCHVSDLQYLGQFQDSIAKEPSPILADPIFSSFWSIQSKQAFYALGEMPWMAQEIESNRHDIFAHFPDRSYLAKKLLQSARDLYQNSGGEKLTPARLQACLNYAKRIAIANGVHFPSLLDWVLAAKGTLGDRFASVLLKILQQYTPCAELGPYLKLRLHHSKTPLDNDYTPRRNLLRDTPREMRSIRLKRDPTPQESTQWTKQWDPKRSCSHIPEDLRLERFNSLVRKKTLDKFRGNDSHSHPFQASFLDGPDLRETIRHWSSGQFWVKEIPPHRGKVDSVIILFDANNDNKYPFRQTWYAEHQDESTLSLYATNPFQEMVGPGIARAQYGGLSLLFPPRSTPDLFQIPLPYPMNLAEQLCYSTLLFAKERLVGFLAYDPPNRALKEIARKLGKTLIWTPLRHFSVSQLEKLRQFHVLNGQHIRSYAQRFIEG